MFHEDVINPDGSVGFSLEEIRAMEACIRASIECSGKQPILLRSSLLKLELLQESILKPLPKYQNMKSQFPGCPRN